MRRRIVVASSMLLSPDVTAARLCAGAQENFRSGSHTKNSRKHRHDQLLPIRCERGSAIHAANIAAHPEARLNTIVDTDRAAAQRLAERYSAVLRYQARRSPIRPSMRS
jgi:hypothetical protein